MKVALSGLVRQACRGPGKAPPNRAPLHRAGTGTPWLSPRWMPCRSRADVGAAGGTPSIGEAGSSRGVVGSGRQGWTQ